MGKVVVVILNYKVKDRVLSCIQSVKKSYYKNFEIVVVDNNSRDEIEKSLEKFKDIKFIQSGSNLGYTGGNNLGIKYALENNAEYVFILNPDTQIDKNCISELIHELKNQKADIAGPKIFFPDKKTIWYAGGVIDELNVLGKHQGLDEKDIGQYNQVRITEYVTGAAVMVTRQVFESIGAFDEKYFLYYEDSDFSYRAFQKGFKIIFVPDAIVYHQNAQSTKLGSPLQDYFITRNRLLFASKYLSFRTQFALLREVLRNLNFKSRRVALYDFIFNNFGKGSFI